MNRVHLSFPSLHKFFISFWTTGSVRYIGIVIR